MWPFRAAPLIRTFGGGEFALAVKGSLLPAAAASSRTGSFKRHPPAAN
jgi:hypothetical protein